MFSGGSRNSNNNGPPIWLIVLVVSAVTLCDQLRPDPHDLALPRIRGRPRLGAHTGAPEYLMSALQKIVADDLADPEQDLRQVKG